MVVGGSVVPYRRQYATSACSGRTTGYNFNQNFECVPPGNFMGEDWVKAYCSEVGGNVTFEHYDTADCAGEPRHTGVFPSGCNLCSDPEYTCYGGGLQSLQISCRSAAVAAAAMTPRIATFILSIIVNLLQSTLIA
ncbi:unnamed protein product [Cladocopium goreaui]|nr:unnamed protein product [Cladocopium goreaui]|mmetsp:Transcript_44928/g.97772  ORF Transcript_44928/g.97772 Transcript_44928/m.97772 type:complete len:136 (-) Transcript_44928:109-516(-)